MNLTPLQGYLTALADSDFSVVFYSAALYQLIVLGVGCSRRARATKGYLVAASISHLLLTAFLLAGFYYATRPVA